METIDILESRIKETLSRKARLEEERRNLVDEVREASPQVDAVVVPRPFLLATLKIVDDYFRLKREYEEFKNRAEERSRRLVEILDSSLGEKETFEYWRGGRRENQKMDRRTHLT